MTDFRTLLANLRRPRLLIRAARHGVQDYRRDRDLGRLLASTGCKAPGPEAALTRLLDQEEQMERVRKSGGAGYSIAHHVELLIALMAEARFLTRPLNP
ncbi:MAG: DUF6477 family protein [Pseudorhodobacter sp.]|jgi:hypothetical protein|nr:DUF6477 family protein [Pseudorhodobacter sp.]